jgi:hypothetical protein
MSEELQQKEDEIKLSDLNFTPMSANAAQGKREPRKQPPTMQRWAGCTITNIRPFKPRTFGDEEPVNPPDYRLQLTIDTHGQWEEEDGCVFVYFNWWEGQNPSELSNWHSVNCAVWPNEKDREGKTPADMVGQQVTVCTMPGKKPGSVKIVLEAND